MADKFEVGVNVPGITHYGGGAILPFSQKGDVDTTLGELQRMKATIIRVFVADDHVEHEVAAERLEVAAERLNDFLTTLAKVNGQIRVIACLTDYYVPRFDGQCCAPKGDRDLFTIPFESLQLLSHEFFAGLYRDNYLPFVETVVGRNSGHKNLYAWEPGNELKDDDSATFIDFMQQVTGRIKQLAPTQAVATGMIRARHTGLAPEKLYPALPDVDVITVHTYDGALDGNPSLGQREGTEDRQVGHHPRKAGDSRRNRALEGATRPTQPHAARTRLLAKSWCSRRPAMGLCGCEQRRWRLPARHGPIRAKQRLRQPRGRVRGGDPDPGAQALSEQGDYKEVSPPQNS